jgi:hypothetical protein
MNLVEKLLRIIKQQGETIPTLTNVSSVSYEHLEGFLDQRDQNALRWEERS